MKRTIVTALVSVFILAMHVAIAEAAIVVYDDTSTALGGWVPTYQPGYNVEAGDQVTLEGTWRDVTGIEIRVFESYTASGTVDAEVRFYKNDGPGGAPGTLIWDSGVIQNIPYHGQYNTFSFAVPSVRVPDTFTWTIAFSNVQTSYPYNFGLLLFDPPAAGTSGDFTWWYDKASSTWVTLNMANIVDNFGATVTVNAVAISGQGTWETTLQPRDLDGNLCTVEAYYDTDVNITWLKNANYGFGSSYDTADGVTDGRMTWTVANTWADGLNINGITGWRLPKVIDTGTAGCDYAFSGTDCPWNVDTSTGEMAHMFYTTLGNKALYDTLGNLPQAGSGLTNIGPFSNLQPDFYWSATEYVLAADLAWNFDFLWGSQFDDLKANYSYAWAVHDGDVGSPIAAIDINIDVKPGSTENPVNPTARGVLPVAILTTEDFDATKVDVSTIQFGRGRAQPVHYALEDVDGDTDRDLMLQFKTEDTGIVCGYTEATLAGKTLEGVSFSGTDNIRTVGCNKVH